MKPEYIGVGNFDTDNYVYGFCRCPLPIDHAIKWARIKDGKQHRYSCICEDCGTEVGIIEGKLERAEGEVRMLRTTNYGVLVDDDGTLNENEKAMLYIKECAEHVGIEVIEGETAFSIPFMAEIMRRLRDAEVQEDNE